MDTYVSPVDDILAALTHVGVGRVLALPAFGGRDGQRLTFNPSTQK